LASPNGFMLEQDVFRFLFVPRLSIIDLKSLALKRLFLINRNMSGVQRPAIIPG
jgi:hypothetical protein